LVGERNLFKDTKLMVICLKNNWECILYFYQFPFDSLTVDNVNSTQPIINAFYDSIPNNQELTSAQQSQSLATFSPYSNPKSMHPKFGSYSPMDWTTEVKL